MSLKGRGVSYVKYELVRTYVGAVADVEIDRTTGKVRVPRFYLVQDCGQIINPDGVKSQLDGNIIQTISRTLIEEVKWDRSMVTTLDWASYPIITFPEVPELHYDLIDRPNERPWGAGETGCFCRAVGDRQCDLRRDAACVCARCRSRRRK